MGNGMCLSDTRSIIELNNVRDWIDGRHGSGGDYKWIQHSQLVKDESSGVSDLVHFSQRANAV